MLYHLRTFRLVFEEFQKQYYCKTILLQEINQMNKTDKNKWDLNQHIEQECIQGSYNRLFPVINKARENIDKAGSVDAKRYAIDQFLQLEEHALELARFALEYFTQSK